MHSLHHLALRATSNLIWLMLLLLLLLLSKTWLLLLLLPNWLCAWCSFVCFSFATPALLY